MPLIETKGAASAQGFGEFTVVGPPPNYIEDVFSTWLYTGNGSTQTINNGIDLAGKGGLVWMKARSIAYPNFLIDTVRGRAKPLSSDTADAASTSLAGYDLTSFNSTGFSLGPDWVAPVNTSNDTFASWTFREQPKFFDVVTYTGNGSNRTISHNLGSTPGCIIVKRTDASANWQVYHRSLTSAAYSMQLNLTNTEASATTVWNSTAPTSTVFSVGTDSTVNANGGTYVAYLFAHNAGGFGLTGTDNVVSCGSWTDSGSGTQTITLGYEPQFMIYKRSDGSSNWVTLDNMRGWPVVSASNSTLNLYPNLSNAESGGNYGGNGPTATGFNMPTFAVAGATYIYIAIRRGPMKTPTSGTSVFVPTNGYFIAPAFRSTFAPDTALVFDKSSNTSVGAQYPATGDRLRGTGYAVRFFYLPANPAIGPGAERSDYGSDFAFSQNNATFGFLNSPQTNFTGYLFARAPKFFDVVCYTGTGSATTINHNLTVAPEMIFVKVRSSNYDWLIYSSALGINFGVGLPGSSNTSTDPAGATNGGSVFWNSTNPTSSVFSVGTDQKVNQNTYNYVAYLFATLAGVSKVGSYTGTGALQTIDCGFTGGARFVFIKRTDSNGGFFIYDSVNGISSSSDPYFLLNASTGQVTGTNYVDTTSVGFQVTAAAPAAINANGGTYIFLAIA